MSLGLLEALSLPKDKDAKSVWGPLISALYALKEYFIFWWTAYGKSLC